MLAVTSIHFCVLPCPKNSICYKKGTISYDYSSENMSKFETIFIVETSFPLHKGVHIKISNNNQ